MPQRDTYDEPVTTGIVDGFRGMRRESQSEYRMMATGPHRKVRPGVPSGGGSADWHARNTHKFYDMLERAREIRINDPIVGKGIQRLATNIIQDGFIPRPESGDEDFDAAAMDEWNAWIEKPETQHEHSWNDCERMAFAAIVGDGDNFAVTVDDAGVGRLQFTEAHLVKNPQKSQPGNDIVLGVELNKARKRAAYWFVVDKTDPNRSLHDGSRRRIDRTSASGIRQVMHLYFPDRFTQTRGITAIQPVDDFVTYHDDIQFAQLVKQQVASCYSILEEMQAGGVPGLVPATAEKEVYSDGNERYTEELYPGKIYRGRPGASLKGFSPNVPNAEYFQHVMMMLQIIAVNLDLPVQVLLLDPSMTNFSGWRGAVEQAKQRWKDLQRMLCGRLHKPVWAWKVNEWAQRNRLIARGIERGANPSSVTWRLPAWPYIEPMKDAQADDYVVTTLQDSRRRVMAKRGLQYEVVLPEIVADNTMAIVQAKQAAAQINAQFPTDDPVKWQEVLSLPLPKNISIAWSDSDQSTGDSQSDRSGNSSKQ